jgi:signal transduction histidine kinase
MESLEREESFSDWLDAHALDVHFAEPLAESGVTLESLNALSASASPAELAVMLRSLATGFTVHALARDVEQAADRVHRLVSAVAGFTQLDRGVSKAPKDVAKGIADTVTMLGMKARAKAVSVHVDLDDGLPDVMASDDLNHVWLHLIDNALDAVPEGGSVHVRGNVTHDELLVCVIDNGPGIPPEIAPRVFDPFFTTKPPGSGVGLGLDIVRRVLASNDGQVALRAEPGRTEFRVTLPVRSVLEPIA